MIVIIHQKEVESDIRIFIQKIDEVTGLDQLDPVKPITKVNNHLESIETQSPI